MYAPQPGPYAEQGAYGQQYAKPVAPVYQQQQPGYGQPGYGQQPPMGYGQQQGAMGYAPPGPAMYQQQPHMVCVCVQRLPFPPFWRAASKGGPSYFPRATTHLLPRPHAPGAGTSMAAPSMAASPTISSSNNSSSRVVVRGAGARLPVLSSARASHASTPPAQSLHLCAGMSTGVAVGAGVLGGMLMADMLFD